MMEAANVVEMRGVHKSYGNVPVLQGIDLKVKANQVLALLGPSGCGKSTILKLLAGFFPPDAGTILLRSGIVNDVPAHKRNLGMVFQEYTLFPHMTVRDNVAFGLSVRRRPRAEIENRVVRALALVGLSEMASRFPSQLSGGQKQRIAIARALAVDPTVLLCDEPLSNLDAKLRKDILLQLKRLQRDTGVTMVYVTHDQEEAVILADQIALLNKGRIEQTADAFSIFERPRTRFGAEFMGYNNFLEARVLSRTDDYATLSLHQGASVGLSVDQPPQAGAQLSLCIREERVRIAPRGKSDTIRRDADGAYVTFEATIANVIYTGMSYVVTCDCGGGVVLKSRVGAQQFQPDTMTAGASVDLLLPRDDLRGLAASPMGSLQDDG